MAIWLIRLGKWSLIWAVVFIGSSLDIIPEWNFRSLGHELLETLWLMTLYTIIIIGEALERAKDVRR